MKLPRHKAGAPYGMEIAVTPVSFRRGATSFDKGVLLPSDCSEREGV